MQREYIRIEYIIGKTPSTAHRHVLCCGVCLLVARKRRVASRRAGLVGGDLLRDARHEGLQGVVVIILLRLGARGGGGCRRAGESAPALKEWRTSHAVRRCKDPPVDVQGKQGGACLMLTAA
jgi:hypothetical protein